MGQTRNTRINQSIKRRTRRRPRPRRARAFVFASLGTRLSAKNYRFPRGHKRECYSTVGSPFLFPEGGIEGRELIGSSGRRVKNQSYENKIINEAIIMSPYKEVQLLV